VKDLSKYTQANYRQHKYILAEILK